MYEVGDKHDRGPYFNQNSPNVLKDTGSSLVPLTTEQTAVGKRFWNQTDGANLKTTTESQHGFGQLPYLTLSEPLFSPSRKWSQFHFPGRVVMKIKMHHALKRLRHKQCSVAAMSVLEYNIKLQVNQVFKWLWVLFRRALVPSGSSPTMSAGSGLHTLGDRSCICRKCPWRRLRCFLRGWPWPLPLGIHPPQQPHLSICPLPTSVEPGKEREIVIHSIQRQLLSFRTWNQLNNFQPPSQL